MCYWENQLSRQAEHSSFHLFFPISKMFRGVHKQLRILKVTTVKQTKIYQKCVWGGSSTFVKEWCEAQKWKCENFTSISVFIPACGAAALIPRIPKSHTISSPTLCVQHWIHTLSHLQLPLSLPQTLFFPAQHCSTSTLQLKESSFLSTLPWAPAAKLPVCLWGQLVIFCVSVRLCVFIESRKEHSLLFRCQLDLVAATVGKARISLWVVNWTTCYGATEGD